MPKRPASVLAVTVLALAACDRAPATATSTTASTGPQSSAGPDRPVVVELFQSQGCSSCPPAEANVNALAGRPDVLALSFAVTYWDQLGWKDTFGSPAWTARQWDYARRAGRAQVATPQVIVNGSAAIVGSNQAQLADTVRRAGAPRGGPAISVSGDTLVLGAGSRSSAAGVWIVRYDPRTVDVPIRAGENGGRTLPHRNIVRALMQIGTWSGKAEKLRLPGAVAGLATAVLVQDGTGGPILSAAKL